MNLKALEEMEPEVIRLINGDNVNHVEFLNTKANYMLQVLPEHAGDDPESGLLRVPEGAEIYIDLECNLHAFYKDNFKSAWHGKEWERTVMNNKNMEIWSKCNVLWQRKTLQQKVDEVRQHLGITNNNTLSVMIGREKSYLRKLLKRKASSATVEKVIAELDALIVVHPTIDSACSEAEEQAHMIEARWSSCGQCVIKNTVIKQANEIAEMWEDSYKQSSKLNAWLFIIIILFIGLFIAWWAL